MTPDHAVGADISTMTTSGYHRLSVHSARLSPTKGWRVSNDGLNLFDDKASAVGGFPTVFRGYEKESVDSYLRDLEAQLRTAREDARRMHHDLDLLRASAGETDFGHLGARATSILTAAERQAAEMAGSAATDAERIVARAHHDAAGIRLAAERESNERCKSAEAALVAARESAAAEAADHIAAARRDAEQIITAAKQQAAATTQAAEEHARTEREAAALDAARIRREAEADANALTARAQADHARVLAGLRETHAQHVTRTRALLTESESAHEASAAALAEQATQAAQIRANAAADAERIRLDALRSAQEIAQSAEREAVARAEERDKAFAARTAELAADIEDLEQRRDALRSQLEELSQMARMTAQHFSASRGPIEVAPAHPVGQPAVPPPAEPQPELPKPHED